MNTKIYYLFIFVTISIFGISAQSPKSAIEQLTANKQLQHASIGFCVKDFTGKEIASLNSHQSRTPASVLKTITTASALELLGGDYRYKTTLAKDKNKENHLLIYGSGDPTLGTSCLNNNPTAFLGQWLTAIKQHFDTTKIIDITIVDDIFGYDGISERWIWQDMGIQYAAPAYGISLFDNTCKLYLNTTKRDTCPTILYSEPAIDFEFTNMLTLNNIGEDNGYMRGEPLSLKRLLTGNIPSGRTSFALKGDIPNPGLLLGQVLCKELQRNNIAVGSITTTHALYTANMPTNTRYWFDKEIFYTHQSPPLRDIIREINVNSNNHYAEHLIRTIGRVKDTNIYSSALKAGIEEVEELWKKRGIDTDALFMYDGCGLAPSNAVSADMLCDMLIYMQKESHNSTDYLQSFPIAGRSGTVKGLLRGTRLVGKVYAKSGTIVNVRCYAGYYINGDKKYAFAIMVNNYNSPLSEVVRAIEKLLLNTF